MALASCDLLRQWVVERDLKVADGVARASRLGGDGGIPVGACEVERQVRLTSV